MKIRPKKGISLIEMLVALGVLAVLAALLIPRILHSSKVDNIHCISRLRNVGAALQTYIGDHDNRLIMRIGGGAVANHYLWPDLLWRKEYLPAKTVEIREMLRCPSWKVSSKIDNGAWPWHTYGLNTYEHGIRKSVDEGSVYEMNYAVVKDPARYVLVADSVTASGDSQTFRLGQTGSARDGVHLRHQEKANIYFLDGRVSSVPRKEAEGLGIPFIYDYVQD